MPNFHRFYIPNSIIFITCVTFNRNPYLREKDDIRTYYQTLQSVKEIHPFTNLAYVILPDHFHWLMKVENGKFSSMLQSFKRNFVLNYKKIHHISSPMRLWQNRFWDHVIRNEHDLSNHFDYIHWNPVKHGYVDNPEDWTNSSFKYWYQQSYYDPAWGKVTEPVNIIDMFFE